MSESQRTVNSPWQPALVYCDVSRKVASAHPLFHVLWEVYCVKRSALEQAERQPGLNRWRRTSLARKLREASAAVIEEMKTMRRIVVKRWDEEDPDWYEKLTQWYKEAGLEMSAFW